MIENILRTIILYAKVARAQVLFMPLLLVICAYLYSNYHYHIVSVKSFVCVSISILFFNLSVNTISEYRDCQKGIDDIHSVGTKYRLVSGIVPKKNVLAIGVASFMLGAVSGIVALYFKPYSLIVPGIIGAIIAFFYSERPLGLKYKAHGEICVFIVYGILIFSSCILSLTHKICLKDILFSIPFGIFTTNVVLANNIRDCNFEKGKTVTLPIKFGLRFSYSLLFFITHVAFLLIPIFIYIGIIPKLGMISLLAYPLLFSSIKKINSPKFVNIFGIIQVTFCILIGISFLL